LHSCCQLFCSSITLNQHDRANISQITIHFDPPPAAEWILDEDKYVYLAKADISESRRRIPVGRDFRLMSAVQGWRALGGKQD
jgi:hypothetical protein